MTSYGSEKVSLTVHKNQTKYSYKETLQTPNILQTKSSKSYEKKEIHNEGITVLNRQQTEKHSIL